jgi:hypothetical protein
MQRQKFLRYAQNGLIGSLAAVFAGAGLIPGANRTGPVAHAAAAFVTGRSDSTATAGRAIVAALSGKNTANDVVASSATTAVATLRSLVEPLSHPKALESAFRAYYAFKAAHPDKVKKPYLYFVDYGQPSTQPRGYVFDMSTLTIVDGPFTVAHGRGSSEAQFGVPTRFSNRSGAATSSLGLYVTGSTYAFSGHAGGGLYHSIGLRLLGQSGKFNDNAFDRGVVAHGAPYVTPSRAGRSEGCPAMEQQRAQRLLPKLSNGAVVFLFAPDENWLEHDPWAGGISG